MNARRSGAVCAGAASAALLHGGGAAWPVALAGWRLGPSAAYRLPRALLLWVGGLEGYGIATIAAVRAARDPLQISRRLLGAWLASSGAIILGLVLSGDAATTAVAGALITFGIMYKLGVVPAYAWAPMLIRHPSPRIMVAGAAGCVLAATVLFNVVPLLGDRANAAWTIVILSAITAPRAWLKVARQWRSDRRCAGTYAAVAVMAIALLWLLVRVVS